MEIVKININELKPYEKNAKIHTPEQIEQIKKSIEEFGMNDPIAVWGKDNLVVEGHGRILALKELGYQEVECIRLDHLTDEERKAYTLAHNKLTMNTDFDLEILSQELADIENINMEDFGFELPQEEESYEVEEDNYEVNLPEEPKAKLGDVYQLGRHVLMCGDSTKEEDVDKLIGNDEIDLVVTDPPYNVDYGSKAEAINKYGYHFSDRHIKNDYMPEYQFVAFLDNAFKNMEKHLKPGGSFYIWHASITVHEFEEALRYNNLKTRQ